MALQYTWHGPFYLESCLSSIRPRPHQADVSESRRAISGLLWDHARVNWRTKNPWLALWNTQILIVNPQSTAHQPQFWILNHHFSILKLPLFNLNSPSTTLSSVKSWIFYSKCPQNTRICDKMSSSATCTACFFFQVWTIHGHIWPYITIYQLSGAGGTRSLPSTSYRLQHLTAR